MKENWNSNRNGIDTLRWWRQRRRCAACMFMLFSPWHLTCVRTYESFVYSTFCNVNYAFISATMNSLTLKCICSTVDLFIVHINDTLVSLRKHLTAANDLAMTRVAHLFDGCAPHQQTTEKYGNQYHFEIAKYFIIVLMFLSMLLHTAIIYRLTSRESFARSFGRFNQCLQQQLAMLC